MFASGNHARFPDPGTHRIHAPIPTKMPFLALRVPTHQGEEPFYLYQIFVTESAQFFSWKTLILVVVGELLFVLLWKVSNLLVAFVAALLIMPVMNSGKVVTAQNIQNTWMAVFGLLICVAAWFFAFYTTRYMFAP